MKNLLALLILIVFGCKRSGQAHAEPLPEKQMTNISYGQQSQQVLDLYLPAGRGPNTKTIVLVHGGGWSGGSRNDLNYLLPNLKSNFPGYAIANIDYRLATSTSPAFPKQIDDLHLAIKHLKESDYEISEEFAFIGTSAGAHLAMLYSYRYDVPRSIKAIASIVGPADFTDPAYTSSPYFHYGLTPLVGPAPARPHTDRYLDVSPAAHVSAKSAPTILFYGQQDPLIPASQGPRLKEKLDEYGVASELHLYPRAGHGNWDAATTQHMTERLASFLKRYL